MERIGEKSALVSLDVIALTRQYGIQEHISTVKSSREGMGRNIIFTFYICVYLCIMCSGMSLLVMENTLTFNL